MIKRYLFALFAIFTATFQPIVLSSSQAMGWEEGSAEKIALHAAVGAAVAAVADGDVMAGASALGAKGIIDIVSLAKQRKFKPDGSGGDTSLNDSDTTKPKTDGGNTTKPKTDGGDTTKPKTDPNSGQNTGGGVGGSNTFGGIKLKDVNPANANSGFGKPPYDPSKPIFDFKADGTTQYVRVYNTGPNSSQRGQWMMKADDIQGLSPKQIKNKFDLPELPTHITDVKPPKKTKIRTGTVNSGNFDGNGGGTQFQLKSRIPDDAFSNPRPL